MSGTARSIILIGVVVVILALVMAEDKNPGRSHPPRPGWVIDRCYFLVVFWPADWRFEIKCF